MNQLEVLLFVLGFLSGAFVVNMFITLSTKSLKKQVDKLRGQVYYWSRQMPVNRKSRRPKKNLS